MTLTLYGDPRTKKNSRIVAGHDGSRVLYDKENPRVEITITPIAPMEI